MFHKVRNAVVTAVLLAVMAPAAFAGGAQLDSKSLIDVLEAKGILSKDEARVAAMESNDSKLKIDATIFADYTNLATKGYGGKGRKRGVNLTRTYLTGRYYLNDTWMMRLTTDFSAEPTLGKQNAVYVKYAFAQGSFFPALRVRFGVIQNPWIPYVQDHLWAHRYVSKIMPDRLGLESSADAGIGLAGRVLGGKIRYQMAILNGAGYNNTKLTNGQDESIRLELRPFQGLIAEVGYRTGYRGKKSFNNGQTSFSGLTTTNTTPGTAGIFGGRQRMVHAMLTYGSGKDYRVGVNYIKDKDRAKQYLETTAYGAWGWANVVKTSMGTLGVLGRYENIKQTPYNSLGSLVTNISDQRRVRVLIGVELKPTKGPVFTLAYSTEKYTNLLGTGGTAPGTIGATTTPGRSKRITRVSLLAKYHF